MAAWLTHGGASVFLHKSFGLASFSLKSFYENIGAVVVEQPKQGGLHGLRAHFKRIETEEQKRLRREAQGIIQRIRQADPGQAEQMLDDSKEVLRELQEAITALETLANEYQAQLDAEMSRQAQEQSAALRSLLIEAQLQAELLQQQVEELDVAYIFMMLAAHV